MRWFWRAAAAALVLGLGFGAYLWSGLPSRADVTALATRNPRRTALMLQREAEAKQAARRVGFSQAWVPLGRVSRHLIHAVIASEDQKFFGHAGVDWEAVKESVEANRKQGRFARGGSTITQQLAKNLFFGTRKTLARKLRELVVARWMEQELTKRRILELYLNVIEWGHGVYGCEAAARRYYAKPCAALDPAEAAGLAAMIPSPRRIQPASPRHARAQRRVLWLMAHAGYIARDTGGLGAEPPPPEPVDEEEEAVPIAPPTLILEPSLPPLPAPSPLDEATPGPEPTPEPSPTALPTPVPTATPPPPPAPGPRGL